jgi:hypothetical protein
MPEPRLHLDADASIRFGDEECDRQEPGRRLVPRQARVRGLLRRGHESPDRKAAVLCRHLLDFLVAAGEAALQGAAAPSLLPAQQG